MKFKRNIRKTDDINSKAKLSIDNRTIEANDQTNEKNRDSLYNCIKLNPNELINYDKIKQSKINNNNHNDQPLNSTFTYPNYGSSNESNLNLHTSLNKNKRFNYDDENNDNDSNRKDEIINVASIIGDIGWFQFFVLVFSGLRECTVGYDALITSVMLQPEHNFICTTNNDKTNNEIIVESRNYGSPLSNYNDTAACYYTNTNETLTSCNSWAFPEQDASKASLIVEWSLVCSRSFYTALIESSFFMGLVLGNIIWGYLADRIGRKKAYLISHSIALIAGSLSLIAPDVSLFIVLRFLAAIGSIGYNIIYTIQMELIGTKHRSYATMFNHLGWGMGAISIPLMASITAHTRIMLSVTPLIALFM